jgi:hypothetical protein
MGVEEAIDQHEDAAGFLSTAAARREGLQRMAQAQN